MYRAPLAGLLMTIIATAGPAAAQTVVDHLGIPGPITVGDRTYQLAWSSQPDAGYTKQEYLPKGARLERYDSMVLVEFLATEQPLADIVAAQVAMVQQRKPADPVANVAIMQNSDKSEFLLDFLVSSKDESGAFILEWNGYRYVGAERGGQPGALLFAISERAYGNVDAEAFLRSLKAFKRKRIEALTAAHMPRPR